MNFDARPYNQSDVDSLKRVLSSNAKDGIPLTFEIKLDNRILVHETTNVERFDELYSYINENSQKLVISLGTPNSRNKEWHTFLMNGAVPEKSLNGVNDVEKMMGEKMMLFTERAAADRTLEKLRATEEQLVMANEYIETLTAKLEELKLKPNSFGGFDLGKFTGAALSEIVRNYPKALDKIPGLGGLARSLNESESDTPSETPQEGSMSFKSKNKEPEKQEGQSQRANETTNGSPENEEDENLAIAKRLSAFLSARLSTAQIRLVESIMVELAEKPELMKDVAELLNIETEEEGE